jgi:hypothetical protein
MLSEQRMNSALTTDSSTSVHRVSAGCTSGGRRASTRANAVRRGEASFAAPSGVVERQDGAPLAPDSAIMVNKTLAKMAIADTLCHNLVIRVSASVVGQCRIAFILCCI